MSSRLLATKSVFAGEFPLTAEFRSGPRSEKRSYEDWIDKQQMPEGYPVDLQTNVLRFAPENYKYVNRFAEEHPETMILSTWRAASGTPKGALDDGDPLGVSNIDFPGHWVLSPGTTLASSISSSDDTLYVESTENMRKGPALLVEIDGSGNKIWENFEYVLITSVGDNDVEVEREYNGSPAARSFFSRTTYVAPMPWDARNRKPYTDFFFNLSEYCPKDARGMTAMDVILQDMLEPLEKGGPLENIGGLDLASGPLTVNPSNADYDLDGVVDPDSLYRDGIKMFYERIRNTLGPNRVLTTSLDLAYLEYINGVNQEGLANPDDPWEEVAETVNEVLAWKRMAKLPMVSLAFQQNMDREEDLLRVQMTRLLNGYSACLGMAADIETGSGSDALDAIKRIELYKGDEKEPHWLGKAIGVKRPAAMTPNLLNGAKSPTDWDNILPALSILRGELFVDGDELVLRPDARDFPGYVTLDLNFDLSDKSDFTVFMEARSDDDQLRRKILLPRVSVSVDSGPSRADITSKTYLPLTFYVRGAGSGSVTIDFRFGEGGDVRFRSLSVHGATDTLACEFEKGLVLVNPSLEDVYFDLPTIFPGRGGYRRLSASEPDGAGDIPDKYRPQLRQALELNNGERLANPASLGVPQRNALFLTADAITTTDDETDDPTSSPTKEPETEDPTLLPTMEPDTEGSTTSPTPEPPYSGDVLSYVDNNTGGPLRMCQGDCDRDEDCEWGLECFKRDGKEGVSGCFGEGDEGVDYCFLPEVEGNKVETTERPTKRPSLPTPMPTKKPMIPPTPRPSPQPTIIASAKPTSGPTAAEATRPIESLDLLEPETAFPSKEVSEPSPAPDDVNVFDISPTDVWTSAPVPENEAYTDSTSAQLKGTPSENGNMTNTNLSKGEIWIIVAFAITLIAVVMGVLVFWRKRNKQASRLYIRQVNDEPAKTGAPEHLRETIVMNTTSSGHASDGSPEALPETKLHAESPAAPLTSRDSIAAAYAVKSASNAGGAVQLLRHSSNHSACGNLEEAVEAGLWEDTISFETPTFNPKVM